MTLNGACTTSTSNDHQYPDKSVPSQSSLHPTYNNTEVMNKMTFMEHAEMYWKFLFDKSDKVPKMALPQETLNPSDLLKSKESGIKAAWLGHSSMLINIDGYSVLTDPVLTNKVSIVGPTRFNKKLPLDVQDLPKVDVVIISHDHYDHLNKYSIQQLAHKARVFIVPQRVGKYLKRWGVSSDKIVELGWWEEVQPVGNLTIAATPSQHFSGRGLFDRNETLWASWVIQTPEHKVFFSGDTGYFSGFKEIGKLYGPFDITFLECGAYNKRWSNIHMFPEQTVQAFFDLRGKILQPIHWATFNLALHAWYEPVERLTEKTWTTGATVSIPMIGQIVDYEKPITTKFWWMAAMDFEKINNTQPDIAVESVSGP